MSYGAYTINAYKILLQNELDTKFANYHDITLKNVIFDANDVIVV